MIKFGAHDLDGNQIAGIGVTAQTFQEMLRGKTLQVELLDLGLPKCKLLIVAGRDNLEVARNVQAVLGEAAHASVDDALIIRKRD